jgi:flagellar biosynthesis/type III secretory pathway M-ring protein FliF/YscJ
MDFFKSQLDRIQKQLSALTPSQKMLTAAMVAIMVMTLVWWGKYAGEPEMESLLPQSISADELPRVEMELEAKGIKHVLAGDKILVPADRKVEAVASLMYSHALPRNAKDGFDAVLQNINPFMSNDQTAKMWNRGKETTVGQIISDFPDVADARVMIDPTQVVRIGGGVDPSATVTITMRSGIKASQQLVDAAADVVQGSLSSLSRSKIKVVVDGYPRRVRQDDAGNGGMFADDQQEKIQKAELYLEDKIKGQLRYIPDLMVAVTVKLNTTQETVHKTDYDPKNVVQKAIESHSKSSENTGAAGSGTEAGVVANAGLSVNNAPAAAPAPAGPSNTQEETTDTFKVLVPESHIDRITPAGDSTPVAAAVRVPLAYFAAIFTQQNPGVKDPSEKQMKGLIDEQLPKIKRDVMMCTNLKSETDIAVETYMDPTPMVVAPQTVTAGVSMALLSGGHIKEVVLGLLAVVSLFMVSMVVKKGTPAPAVAVAAANASAGNNSQAPVIDVGGEIVGEVGSGVTTLDGMELDDDALRTQQMLEQVSSLVKENPDSAATLVKRWLNRS